MSKHHKKAVLYPTYGGAALGFVAYLILGVVPGLLYGGYMGLVMASVVLGAPVEPTLLAKVITGGGMLLGLVASLFFFLVVGALVGTVLGMPFIPLLKRVTRSSQQAASSPEAFIER